MILAGLVSVADWIGSNTDYFGCAAKFDNCDVLFDFEDLNTYLEFAEKQANEALSDLGWLNWTEYKNQKDFDELFPEFKEYPKRELQTQAIKITEDLNKQGIVVIESPMGEGKTEAAMFLADWFNYHLKQRGIYFALPTQATSNQMFGRVQKFLRERFDEKLINLQLLHGHSSLSAEFEILKNDFKELRKKVLRKFTELTMNAKAMGVFRTLSGRNGFRIANADCSHLSESGRLTVLMAVLQTKHVFCAAFRISS